MSAQQPHDIDSERSVLGSILYDASCLQTVIDEGITAEAFYANGHQLIFNAILDVQEMGMVPDQVTVCARLKDLRKLDAAGGMVYVATLAENVPSSANVAHYCRIVQDKSIRRKILRKSYDLAIQSQDAGNSVIEILAQYQAGLGIEQPRKAEPFAMDQAIKDLRGQIDRGFPGIDPDYDILRKTIRKFIPGTLIIVGAYTSIGKSAFAVDLVSRLYRKGNPSIAIFSVEMSVQQYILRLLANETTFPTYAIRENRIAVDSHIARLDLAYRHFSEKKLHIYDNLYNFNDIRKSAADIKAMGGLDIVIIDYVQNVLCEGRTIYERMSRLSTQIFAMAKDLGVTVIALSQVNNESAKDPDNPVIGYKGAGEIAAAADVGIWLEKGANDRVTIKVRKNRDGRTMEGELQYAYDYTRFEEIIERKPDGREIYE